MARYAVIDNGVVTNIAEAEAAFAVAQGWVAAPSGCEQGWLYNGSFTPVARAIQVPAAVTRYQFLAAIRAINRAADFKAHILTLPEAQQEAWQNRQRIFRDSAMVEAARTALGASNAAVDNLFRAAEGIED